MRVLFVGDIVGRNARNFVQEKIVNLKSQLQLDAIIVNVENAAGGFGVTPAICDDFLMQEQMCLQQEIMYGIKEK